MKLLLSLSREVFSKSICNILLGEEDAYTLERSVIRCHAVVLQVLDGMHSLFWHILLRQYLSKLLGAVVAEIDEDDHVALLYLTVDGTVGDRLDELVGNTLVIRLLHSSYHIVGRLTSCRGDEVIGLFHTVPTFVAVHSIETAYDRRDVGIVLLTLLRQLLYEAFTRLRVCVASVHETVYEHLLGQSIFLAYLDELEKMVERGMHTAV